MWNLRKFVLIVEINMMRDEDETCPICGFELKTHMSHHIYLLA